MSILRGECVCGRTAAFVAEASFGEVYLHASAAMGPEVPLYAWAAHVCEVLKNRICNSALKAFEALKTGKETAVVLVLKTLFEIKATSGFILAAIEQLSQLTEGLFAVRGEEAAEHDETARRNTECIQGILKKCLAAFPSLSAQLNTDRLYLPRIIMSDLQYLETQRLFHELWQLHRRWVVKSMVYIADTSDCSDLAFQLAVAGVEPSAEDPVSGVMEPGPVFDAVGFVHLALAQLQASARMICLSRMWEAYESAWRVYVRIEEAAPGLMNLNVKNFVDIAKGHLDPALLLCKKVLVRYSL